MISGIYIIRSRVKPERCYIGSAANIKARWNVHRYLLKRGNHHSCKLQRHSNKYGLDDLIFEALVYCNEETLIKTEQEFMDICNPYFNECRIAGNLTGMRHSDETLQKMSAIHRGQIPWIKGKHHSDESKLKISAASKGRKSFLGRKHSDATKLKMSEAQKKRKRKPLSDEVRKKISESLKGNVPVNKGMSYTEETRKKISEKNGMRGKKHTQETKKKMSETRTGKTSWRKGKKGIYSEETLQKMRKSNQRAWDRRKQKQKEETLCQA